MPESPEQKSLREERSRTFGDVADVYERTRPSYPERATRWLADGQVSRVLELGAGTGKLTAQMAAWGHEIIATEPSSPMLERLAAQLDVPAVRSGAEQLPFANDSFDVVVVAQAYHWFDTTKALPEIARVLRPAGLFSLIWNLRDESIPWTRKLAEIVGSEDHDLSKEIEGISGSGFFEPAEHAKFGFWQDLDLPGLLGLVQSRSYIAALSESERMEVMERVRELYDSYGRGPDGLRLRYRTDCYRARVIKDALAPEDVEPPGGGDLLFDFR